MNLDLDLEFERLIGAPPERVFDAFTSPGGQREFYGQDDPGWIVESRCDLRVGGVWSIAFGPSRGELYHHRHVFEAIDRPRRILRGDPGEPASDRVHCSTTYADGCVAQVFRP